ncbi:hypothetical protein NM688_g917 [Phlebia brevispora]|uniref:Uncharacterized protein n=1 Tax=Phlebia brevispora TaxID=194682 RepID=A0ACC1TDC6_9APHY|nr:hypothetical protein NM688_g917 [Phlebia brevispora]
MPNLYIPPPAAWNPKSCGGVWAASGALDGDAGVGAVRVLSTFLWMSDLSVRFALTPLDLHECQRNLCTESSRSRVWRDSPARCAAHAATIGLVIPTRTNEQTILFKMSEECPGILASSLGKLSDLARPFGMLFAISAIFAAIATASPALAVPAQLVNRQTITESGTASYYDVGLGACGVVNQNSDLIVAIPSDVFNSWPGATSNPSSNPICGQKAVITYVGKSVTVTVEDECPLCGPTDIELSLGAFSALADPELGRISVTWTVE